MHAGLTLWLRALRKAVWMEQTLHHFAFFLSQSLEENVDLEVVTGDLAAVAQKLATHGAATLGSDGLDDICQRCTGTATELLTALEGFRVSGQKSRVKSVRKALKAIWGKRRVGEMRTRLEGYRDEIQFHVLVKLKYGFDVEATRQCERFDTLDAHAKAIFEAISQQQESIKDAIQIESLKSDDRHTNTITTIVAKQEEVYGEISRKLDETGELTLQAVIANGESVHNLISSEGSRSDERHRETTEIIVTKQTESHTEVIETLQSLDSTSRTEQEATRREVEELKKAMKQIEEDMKRRDEELKELLQALSRTQNDLERKGLRERSNAVTVALVALMTIHETLQVWYSTSAQDLNAKNYI
ncbi:hypothetical protein L207DRAFT_59761 [Hyaloscypha variabilis F]|uniref:Uncharacterized protein n=1 Tax=Hyaloscypha variabilis (strain UAMH 11265 / GT02V1 / F) TaxID=1149755 RepID=A0A2J6RHK6_HYAVF|nr:hypothetical protein L207DRAFT_59761 [Hyaloscypha variabilis F]